MGLAFISTLGFSAPTLANWQQAQRQSIVHGVQAVLMCNGLFTSHRSLTQVFDQELKYLEPRALMALVVRQQKVPTRLTGRLDR